MPDPSGGTAPELDPARVEYGQVKVWSPDGRHQYDRKSHHPVANVLLTNRSDENGLTTMKAFVTYLDAPGGAKELGERGSVRQYLYKGLPVRGAMLLEYIQFAEFDTALGKDKAAKGRYEVGFGPSADDIRVKTDVTLLEDIFFDEMHPVETVPKLLTFEGPKCVFRATPTPVEDFLEKYYGKLSHADYALLDRAARTFEWNALGKTCQQRVYADPNVYHPYRAVNPSSAWFKGLWNWDSAFIMMATRRWDPELARDQMRLWMLLQTPDGMYPDGWNQSDDIMFPPSVYNSKPPVFAWAMWQLHKTAPDREFLKTVYVSLKRSVDWWMKNRWNAEYGLFHYDGGADKSDDYRRMHAGGESGWDDSPRWDGDAWHVLPLDLNAYHVLTYRAFRDFATGRFNRAISPASYMPLLIGTASQERADRMAKHAYRLEPGWPSAAYDDPKYDPMGYWRGRTWLNIAYMALKGLRFYGYRGISDNGKKTLFGWIRNDPSAIYETYNSRTGLPCGAPHFSWSCTFVMSFILDWDLPRNQEMPAPFL